MIKKIKLNPLSASPTKWPNTLKQFVGKLPTNCLNVFGHFLNSNRINIRMTNDYFVRIPYRDFRSALECISDMINNFIISFRFLIQSWGSWRNIYIFIIINFRKSSIVVPNKIYQVLTTFFMRRSLLLFKWVFGLMLLIPRKSIFPSHTFWKVPCWLPSLWC